jgi:3-ketosteroid 9alpha-monooxygenase subunit A
VRPSSIARKVVEIKVREGGAPPPLRHVFEG